MNAFTSRNDVPGSIAMPDGPSQVPSDVEPARPDLRAVDRWWRAANYLSVGQIYLLDNPLLERPIWRDDIKPRLLGHWGTTPGLNFVYAHLNRVIRQRDANLIFMAGPGHGGPAVVANAWLEGTYSEIYPAVTQDAQGVRRLFRQFSFPGGIPSHASPDTPGSIHEGGELGYALSHAFGAAFDNPDLVVACVVGDGEAETGPLATAWHSNKFLDPSRDGAVLPILHLNGYKIAGPTVLSRIPREELTQLFRGYGWEPMYVDAGDRAGMHSQMAAVLDQAMDMIRQFQQRARGTSDRARPHWPMIVLVSPKGWTGPATVDGLRVEDSWRSHQVPLSDFDAPGHLECLDAWMRSYRPEELFDGTGRPGADLLALAPQGGRRMSANPHANGGRLLRALDLPDVRDHAVAVDRPGSVTAEATRVQGGFIREVVRRNMDCFRVFSPDETASNRWGAVLEVTDRCFMGRIEPTDDHLSPSGRVMEVLSEHQCEGWLEGYLLSGRHGFFSCYEAFIHVVASMLIQHAKWLKVSRELPWRVPVASLNLLLTSHVWRQDHNGFSHQDPGVLDMLASKSADVVRLYLPPDANTLLCITDHCLRSRGLINAVVAGKQPAPQWLSMEQARAHCAAGAGVWDWASDPGEPDVVMACCGDVPTLETLAAVQLLRQMAPDLKIRVVNVVDLMRLESVDRHPHGLGGRAFIGLFTRRRPVIFAFHGYPSLIHRLVYSRANHAHFHVHGFMEQGTTTTPFDMAVLNRLDRFHLAMNAVSRVPRLAKRAPALRAMLEARLAEHATYIRQHGEDLPEIRKWQWTR
ncbi:xylulose-5-phosphate/fructose-6-phosphate phosphoketolase [Panacagrimonas perspica]|uniref:Probable phosphoketolase n=2 Tax=Panacagrimonas perspica TaxID=381431 RepID=A0A4V3F682_9GAMM|nr:phosphoketolase family protein [Panacagrimonas perspica]TDU31666.1 xylulose-5-phosphate/fructose-6-phosphate phosphoketolase [Panacagrimonas perspica]